MTAFAAEIVSWQRAHGRHDMPWQESRDPYRIWISEIMLQQTQVATVIPYYDRFMKRFPTVAALASAPLDDVLALWSGLGYYSRARNLHRAAVTIRDVHHGQFPETVQAIEALPGIGRSTAAAIAVFAFGAREAILDGNVKRVLARVCGIAGYPGDSGTADRLWQAAERLLPERDVEAYTQGLMDLGATVCLRRRPLCDRCPAAARCVALAQNRTHELPSPRPRKPLPHRATVMLVLEHAGKVLLEKRPAPGIWGGLWCFPEVNALDEAVGFCRARFGANVESVEPLPDITHGFTHFSLTISPRRVAVSGVAPHASQYGYLWLRRDEARRAGIPAPVARILDLLTSSAALNDAT
jgi:A/G-specific adenine glycosylase